MSHASMPHASMSHASMSHASMTLASLTLASLLRAACGPATLAVLCGWLALACDDGSAAPTGVASGGSGGAAPAAGGAAGEADTPDAAGASGSSAGAPSPSPPAEPPPSPAVTPDAGAAAEGLLGTAERPQLSSDRAARATALAYLAAAGSIEGLTVDDWDPTAGVGDIASFTPNFQVASGGTYPTVQSAVSAAVATGSAARQYIAVAPGTYRELVCVPAGAPPITLYGTSADAAETVIVFDNYSGKVKAVGTPANPCNPNLSGTTIGTSGSTTFAVYSTEFRAKNLSFVNDTDEAAATSPSVQAVALTVQGDRASFENVRVLGNQDTLFFKTSSVDTVSRSHFKDCYVEGDTDFIFGRGTAVLEGCTIHSVTSRTANGVVIAPSTDSRNPFGILVNDATFSADLGAATGSTHLGRAWDESQGDVATYAANVASGIYPNGQATVRGSVLGAHIQKAAPWRPAATTARPYSSVAGAYPANRLYEFENTGPGSAAAPE
jgi:pectinesterase